MCHILMGPQVAFLTRFHLLFKWCELNKKILLRTSTWISIKSHTFFCAVVIKWHLVVAVWLAQFSKLISSRELSFFNLMKRYTTASSDFTCSSSVPEIQTTAFAFWITKMDLDIVLHMTDIWGKRVQSRVTNDIVLCKGKQKSVKPSYWDCLIDWLIDWKVIAHLFSTSHTIWHHSCCRACSFICANT